MTRPTLFGLMQFGGREARATSPQTDGECPVCDHPFGHMAHLCLSSGDAAGRGELVGAE